MRERLRRIPIDRRRELLMQFVQAQAAAVLGHAVDAVSRMRGFSDLGMDSLASSELRTHLQQGLECTLPSTVAFDYPNVEALGTYLMNEVLDIPFQEIKATATVEQTSESDLASLDRDRIAALLTRELSELEEESAP
jgi:acyl carrier protein